jgi:hypothetical protein
MSIKSKLLPALLAALMMVSGSLFALTAEEAAQMELDMEKEMKALLLTGISFENAVETITKKYGDAMKADPAAATKAMFSAINTVAKAQDIKTDSTQYAKAIKTASVEMEVLSITVEVISAAAVSADVPVNVVANQIPTTGTVTATVATGTDTEEQLPEEQLPKAPPAVVVGGNSNTSGSGSSPAG